MLGTGPAAASGNNSVVECDLAKVEVAGSNPVSRSKNLATSDESRGDKPEGSMGLLARHLSTVTYHCLQARYPSGKGEVCKTFMREFDSHPRLQFSPN